jgi:DNA-binding beta-propeller fold protein YncE
VAYGAAAGRQLWVSRYNGPENTSEASSVAASRAGTTVYVTGFSENPASGDDYATVAYSAATGRQRWVSRYINTANGGNSACCVAVSPAGTAVFVTGYSFGGTTGIDYATVAYRG